MCYDYYGDDMKNNSSLFKEVKSEDDILNLNHEVKYINIDITLIDLPLLKALKMLKGYYISDNILSKKGYIYMDDKYLEESINTLLDIINNIPSDLSILQEAKYLYITLGKIINININTSPEKNENIPINTIWMHNNPFSALALKEANNESLCKLYLLLCSIRKIPCEIITDENNYQYNQIIIEGEAIKVDLYKDLPFINAKFRTRHFGKYNNTPDIDKTIRYISEEYTDDKIKKELEKGDTTIEKILQITSQILNIGTINPSYIKTIYESLFLKFDLMDNIIINNLYYNTKTGKKHFILISTEDKHYSYNYKTKSFDTLDDNILLEALNKGSIGLYLNEEEIPLIHAKSLA